MPDMPAAVFQSTAGTSKTPSKTSSDGSPVKEQNFMESLKSQVDGGNTEDIIQGQKKALERFEKTNEMLATCSTLAEKRLEKARKEFAANKEQILQAKADLDSIFRRILLFKRTLAREYPEQYTAQATALQPRQQEQ